MLEIPQFGKVWDTIKPKLLTAPDPVLPETLYTGSAPSAVELNIYFLTVREYWLGVAKP